mmetsp:Transcript_835/g.2019  ORF Transcript_835/g.2019 Transcript_835/m.2019 type:complete len:412 (+) Transcript_835:212-1447(+)
MRSPKQQRQQQQQQRRRHPPPATRSRGTLRSPRTIAALALAAVAAASSSSHPGHSSCSAWVSPNPPSSSSTAQHYKVSPALLAEDEVAAAARATAAATTNTNNHKTKTKNNNNNNNNNNDDDDLSKARRFPWMEGDGPDSDPSDNTYLDLWNWQFSFFEENLTNLRLREDTALQTEEIRDLYYATTGGKNGEAHERQRVYTVSLESDEYRDIRMTYMHCPGMQNFRCLSYPRNGDLPLCGMVVMKIGRSRHCAVMDYEPVAEGSTAANRDYGNKLLAMREDFPSMAQAITHKNFDGSEKRKFLTTAPLVGRCDEGTAGGESGDDAAARFAGYKRDVGLAQRDYVRGHAALTRSYGTGGEAGEGRALETHAAFDTYNSEREPAGDFLRGVFGPEVAGKLVHNVIFPLSRHKE